MGLATCFLTTWKIKQTVLIQNSCFLFVFFITKNKYNLYFLFHSVSNCFITFIIMFIGRCLTLSSGIGERSRLAEWSWAKQNSCLKEKINFFAHLYQGTRYFGVHLAEEEACRYCIYLSHTLSSLVFLVQGGCVHRFVRDKIGALNVINGFDFWNGS